MWFTAESQAVLCKWTLTWSLLTDLFNALLALCGLKRVSLFITFDLCYLHDVHWNIPAYSVFLTCAICTTWIETYQLIQSFLCMCCLHDVDWNIPTYSQLSFTCYLHDLNWNIPAYSQLAWHVQFTRRKLKHTSCLLLFFFFFPTHLLACAICMMWIWNIPAYSQLSWRMLFARHGLKHTSLATACLT